MTATHSADRLARAVLSRVGEPGDIRLTTLVQRSSPEAVLADLRARGIHGDLHDGLATRLAAAAPERDLADARARGIRFLTPEDDEWPDGVADLAHVPALHERGGPPIGLWVRGPLRLAEAAAGAVAIVGSRSATSYGTSVAAEIGAAVAGTGRAVFSGAAFGVDQAGHRGALAVRGPTVAVLACGVDRAYPRAHVELLSMIADVGLLVSEAAPGCAPTRTRFLARNRLIAALAVGTVVVEAAVRSGALNTANWASSLSRMLMGVPGPVTSAQSEGVHRLIRTRDGLLVTSGADVLEAVGDSGQHLLDFRPGPVRSRDRLSTEERQVLDAVPKIRGAPVDRIARTAGLPASSAATLLTRLHDAGFVEHSRGHWRLRAREGGEP